MLMIHKNNYIRIHIKIAKSLKDFMERHLKLYKNNKLTHQWMSHQNNLLI